MVLAGSLLALQSYLCLIWKFFLFNSSIRTISLSILYLALCMHILSNIIIKIISVNTYRNCSLLKGHMLLKFKEEEWMQEKSITAWPVWLS